MFVSRSSNILKLAQQQPKATVLRTFSSSVLQREQLEKAPETVTAVQQEPIVVSEPIIQPAAPTAVEQPIVAPSQPIPKTQQIPWQTIPPPTSSQSRIPYFVHRTAASKQLPVYKLHKRGGTLRLTQIRKTEGNIGVLREHIIEHLGIAPEKVYINGLTKHVFVKGHVKHEVERFLMDSGF